MIVVCVLQCPCIPCVTARKRWHDRPAGCGRHDARSFCCRKAPLPHNHSGDMGLEYVVINGNGVIGRGGLAQTPFVRRPEEEGVEESSDEGTADPTTRVQALPPTRFFGAPSLVQFVVRLRAASTVATPVASAGEPSVTSQAEAEVVVLPPPLWVHVRQSGSTLPRLPWTTPAVPAGTPASPQAEFSPQSSGWADKVDAPVLTVESACWTLGDGVAAALFCSGASPSTVQQLAVTQLPRSCKPLSISDAHFPPFLVLSSLAFLSGHNKFHQCNSLLQ